MKCAACGGDNQPSASFCFTCGARFASEGDLASETAVRPPAAQSATVASPSATGADRCPTCEALRYDDAPFCRTCGRPFRPVAATDDATVVSPAIASEPTIVAPAPPPHVVRTPQTQPPAKQHNPFVVGLLSGAVVLVAAGAAFLLFGERDPTPPVASEVTTSASAAPPASTEPPGATSTAPTATTAPATSPPAPLPSGDLGLASPIVQPACDDSHITIVASAVDPSRYAATVAAALDRFPGSSYLVTTSCPSLNQDVEGNDIYVVFFGPFADVDEACEARSGGGPDAYVRTLSASLPSTHTVSC